MNSIFTNVLIVFHVAVCLLLCLVVLMQRPKQEGLGAAFGGGMTDQAFGARTTDVLQKGTVYLGTLLFVITLALAVLVGAKSKSSGLDKANAANNEEQLSENVGDLPAVDPEEELVPAAEETPAPAEGATPAPTPAEEETPAPAESSRPAQRDTETGAISGAALGGIIGHQSAKGLEGAAIGAAAGGVSGNEEVEAGEETPEQP